MEVFDRYSEIYSKEQHESMSLQNYLLACRDDPTYYASAAERMVAAIGEPEIIDPSRDPRFACNYDIGLVEPNIQVTDVDLLGERHLKLQHIMHDRTPLAEKSRAAVLEQIRKLWGYDVSLTRIDAGTDEVVVRGGDGWRGWWIAAGPTPPRHTRSPAAPRRFHPVSPGRRSSPACSSPHNRRWRAWCRAGFCRTAFWAVARRPWRS